jgi:glycerol-3-phosphate dehydrogenase subunit B
MDDLLVIGAGLSGLCAALTAADGGASVKVIAKGLGALHWAAGTIDLLGYLPGDEHVLKTPLSALASLPESHPYRLLEPQMISAALARLQDVLTEQGLSYLTAGADRNWLLPSPVGAWRPVWLAPQAQVTGDQLRAEPMLIVGFHGLRDFYPKLIAENLTRQGAPARCDSLPLTTITERHDSNNVHLASALDEPANRRRLAGALKTLVRSGERIGLPAILGLEQHALVLAELEASIGAPIFEIPTLPPSVPGVRLFQALRRHLLARGVRVEANMEAVGFHAEERTIQWVETATSSRPLKHRAGHFLLASGGVLGGGFNSDHSGRIWETVFDLPLTAPHDRRQWFRPHFFDAQGQPIFRSGVAVNRAFQPLDSSGQTVFANLWAAGGVLAHADPIAERSLEGLAVTTGTAAAAGMIH